MAEARSRSPGGTLALACSPPLTTSSATAANSPSFDPNRRSTVCFETPASSATWSSVTSSYHRSRKARSAASRIRWWVARAEAARARIV